MQPIARLPKKRRKAAPRGSARASKPPRIGDTKRGAIQVVRLGSPRRGWRDLYHVVLTISWRRFLGGMTIAYLGVNLLFAAAYLLDRQGIAGARPGSLADSFFFSVETLATIGYGAMYPQSLYANILMTVELLIGMMGFAIAAGLVFARVSRPTARVMFSRVATIAPFDGTPTLMFRAANQRLNRILEANVRVTIARSETTLEGMKMRRFHDLRLARERTPLFALSWTVLHPITEDLPLFGATAESLEADEVEFIVTMTGLDETFSQTIHARHSFVAADLRWDERFADIMVETEDGRRAIDYLRFHETGPL